MIICRVRSVQVVAQQPIAGVLPPVSIRVVIGELLRVLAQQVVHPPPSEVAMGAAALDQMRAGKRFQVTSGGEIARPRQCGSAVDQDIWAGVDWEQPEQPCTLRVKTLVGQIERGAHRSCANLQFF